MPVQKEILNKREQIDNIDDQLLKLLNRRAELSLSIRQLKCDNAVSLFDPKREEEIVERLCKNNPGPLYDDDVRRLFLAIMKTMRGLPNE